MTTEAQPRSAAKQALLEQRLRRLRPGGDAQGAAGSGARVPRRPDGEEPCLSFAQERLWFMEQYAPGTAAYGVPLLLRFGPGLDRAALAGALRDLTERHDVLRSRFPATEDGRPRLVIDPVADVPLAVHAVPDETAAEEFVATDPVRPFDLATGPLLRVSLVEVAGGADHLVVLDLHHIVTDGWSNDVLLADLAALYRARRDGTEAGLAPLPVRYSDFARWQRDRADGAPGDAGPAGDDVAYWSRTLRGVPALELPTDAPRPATQTYDGASHHFDLGPELVAALDALGRRHRATRFMVLLAGYRALLARYTGQDDLAIGTPVAGRSAPELDGLAGMFVNMLPLRLACGTGPGGDDPTGAGLVARCRDTVLDALAHQDVPFEKVITELGLVRDVSRSPLFQTMLVLQNYERPDQAAAVGRGTDIGWRPVELPATRYDLELHAYGTPDGGLRCRFVYNTALFEPDTPARMAAHLTTLLTDLVARPDTPVSRLRLLGEDARAALIAAATGAGSTDGTDGTDGTESAVGGAAPVTGTLHGLFEARAARTPDAPAVSCGDDRLTYGELNRAANRVAHRLLAHGVGPDSLVAVAAERGVPMIVAVLGVLKAGAGYVPLDPAYPAERLRFIVEDTGADVLVAEPALRDLVPARVVVELDDTPAEETDPAAGAGAANAAYVIYTSGSTGRPKGVLVEHRQVLRLLTATEPHFGFGAGDVWAMLHSYAFDFSVWELWGALAYGGRLVVVPTEVVRDHDALLDVLRTERVTVLNQTPAAFRGLRATLAATGRDLRGLDVRVIVFGGDALRVRELGDWFGTHGDAAPRLVNMYGITETTVHVTVRPLTEADARRGVSSPIGVPLGDLRALVLDRHAEPVPVGVPGELYVSGAGLARGYLNRPDLNAERFPVLHGERRYRTGDLVRALPSGELEFLGRVDQQVKVRGYRIELGEIESALLAHDGVRQAVVLAREDGTGDRTLVAYVVPSGEPPAPAELRDHLGRTLPKYMVPSVFVPLEALPLTPNGKLDAAALPAPDAAARDTGEYVAPSTEAEHAVAAIWREVLGTDRVGVDDDFFALGGHSLLATQVIARMRALTEGTGAQVGVMDLFQHPTVRGLAALVSDGGERTRHLLYKLTKHSGPAECTYVCVPYGGGSAVVYQPIADAMPAGHDLWSVAIPGHDVGLDEDSLPFDELAARCAEEILDRVRGPLVLYGHCGVGGALTVELARRLEAAGRELEAVYVGGIFPFAKPAGRLSRLHAWFEERASNRTHANWLKAMGVDMDDIDPAQADRIISNMRRDGVEAEEHFTRLLEQGTSTLRAPVISVVGERDPVTEFYSERFREWRFVADSVALVVLDEAGHFFLRYRADELVRIITRTHLELTAGTLPEYSDHPRPRWWLHDVDLPAARATTSGGTAGTAGTGAHRPTMRRFALVSTGQLVSTAGSALTAWAIPIHILQTTGSLVWFGLSGAITFIPLLLAMPVAGAVADRFDRRKVMFAAGCVAVSVELVFAIMLLLGRLPVGFLFLIVLAIGFASTFQRLAFISAIPQLVPKRHLGRANGVSQLINGFTMMFVPMMAAAMLALIGLRGILIIDLVSYAFALTVLALVRFPATLGRVRRESFGRQLLGGLRLSWGQPHFRAMLLYFGIGNLLYSPALLLMPPLILAFATLGDVGRAGVAEGLGAAIGAITIMLWGGPKRRRMRTIMLVIAVAGLFVALTGLRPSLPMIMIALFGTGLALAVADGIYLTIIETKVPQRFHARVIALNQTIAWSVFPLGFAFIGPLAATLSELALAEGGSLAGSVGAVIGVGEGRGVAFVFVLCGLAMTLNALGWMAVRRLRRLDVDLPDALPDDLVGVRELEARAAAGPPADRSLSEVSR
ncbi:MAG TPA: amino acid adenylation domain-containing protein [Pseudonocardiaceae bacterium]